MNFKNNNLVAGIKMKIIWYVDFILKSQHTLPRSMYEAPKVYFNYECEKYDVLGYTTSSCHHETDLNSHAFYGKTIDFSCVCVCIQLKSEVGFENLQKFIKFIKKNHNK